MKGYVEKGEPKYQEWIDEYVHGDPQRKCKPMAIAMAKEFPELRVVGISSCFSGHAWCVNKQNEVVDPTAHQFDFAFDYSIERLELADFPIGKCHWCGETIWPDTAGAKAYTHEEVGPHKNCNELFRRECEGDEVSETVGESSNG